MSRKQVNANGERQDLPASCAPACVQEDEYERCPERTEESDQASDQSQHHAGSNNVAQRLSPKKAGEGVALHRLEDVVLSCVEDFRIIATLFLDVVGDVVQDALRENDLAFCAGQKVCVEDLLRGSADISARDGVLRRAVAVDLGRGRVGRVAILGHVAGPRRRFGRLASVAVLAVLGRVLAGGLIAQEGGEPALALAVSVAAGALIRGVSLEVIEDLGGSLASATFLELGGANQNGSSEFAHVVAAEGHVLGDIEPVFAIVITMFLPQTSAAAGPQARRAYLPPTRSPGNPHSAAHRACKCKRRRGPRAQSSVARALRRGWGGGRADRWSRAWACATPLSLSGAGRSLTEGACRGLEGVVCRRGRGEVFNARA